MSKKKGQIIYSILIMLSFTLFLTCKLEAATFTVGSNSGSPGDTGIPITIDLSSDPGDEVCSFNFDLNFDTLRLSFKGVTLGSVAEDADKDLYYSNPQPYIIRAIVYGLNQNIVEDGTILNFTFDILPSAPSGSAALTITDLAVADPYANPVPSTTVPGEIEVEEAEEGEEGALGGYTVKIKIH